MIVPAEVGFALAPDRWLAAGLLTTRVAALLFASPFFGIAAIPGRVRGGLALMISLILLPSVAPPTSAMDLSHLGLMVLAELAVGTVIGVTLSLFFAGVSMAGEIVGVQMGLGAATALDPTSNVAMPVIGNMLYMTAIAIWFAVGGHLLMLNALADSYALIPAGGPIPLGNGLLGVALALQITLEAAVRIAAPVLVALLLANTAMAVLGRTAPQMNVFMSSFPITISLGLIVVGLTLRTFGRLVSAWTLGSYAVIGEIVARLAGG